MPKQTFEQWKAAVNKWIAARVGLSADDLPDWDYYGHWVDGTTPRNAAAAVIRAAKEY